MKQGTRKKDKGLRVEPLPVAAAEFSTRLLRWYGREGRELPWRNTRDPYRIWLAEIMLQQTTVRAVIDYYRAFLDRFPTLEALAAATVEEVIDHWAGLGYYSRARNLHKTARRVVTEFFGAFPSDVETLQTLPGVGRSTAGAISALAFEQRAPILDGNVRRVLCRLCALEEPPRSPMAEKQLWAWAEELTPEADVHDYTQAIMDLGATICTPRSPLCEQCPVVELCQARAHGLGQVLALKQAKKEVPSRSELTLVITHAGRFLVRRRPAEGFLGGLWEFPNIPLGIDADSERQLGFYLQEHGVGAQLLAVGSVKHLYSHFRLDARVYRLDVDDLPRISEGDWCWISLPELTTLALHGAHKKVLELIQSSESKDA